MPDGAAGEATRYVAVGQVGAARGVRGDVFVRPLTDDPDERFAPGTVLETEPATAGPLTVESSNSAGGRLVVHFDGVDDRTRAESLRGVLLQIEAGARPEITDPDEFYVDELVGMAVRTTAGRDLGPVIDVVDIAGSDYLVLEIDGREHLVPFVAAIVPTVDAAARLVVIDPPDGLFEL